MNTTSRVLLVLLLTYSWSSVTFGVLTVSPSNTVSMHGQSVTVLTCSSSLSDAVDWWWTPSGSSEQLPIVQSNTLVYLYDQHVEVRRGPDGQQDLVIYDVGFNDAGRYTCYDEGRLQTPVDKGYYASAELIVTDNILKCFHNMSADGVIDSDICGVDLQPDIINITCSLRFTGNIAPTLAWSDGTKDILSRDVISDTEPNLTVSSTVIVRADEHRNGSVFACSAGKIWNTTNITLYDAESINVTWTSDPLNKLRFGRSTNQTPPVSETVCTTSDIICSLEASESILKTCDYKWSQNATRMTVESPVLVLRDFKHWHGLFTCTVSCQVRGRTCRVSPRSVDSSLCPESVQTVDIQTTTTTTTTIHHKPPIKDGKSFALFMSIGFAVILLILIPAIIYKLKPKINKDPHKKTQPVNNNESTHLKQEDV